VDIEAIYKSAGALLSGHFLLSSGNHSGYYMQSAKVLENPKTAEKLAIALADEITKGGIKATCVCAPALGGILAGYELARALGIRSIFAERAEGGQMALRRGFAITAGEPTIVCEDIITTGKSALETARLITDAGGKVVAFAALANRGFCRRANETAVDTANCKLPADIPFFALADFAFEIYAPNECPLCKTHGAPIKPGSRPNH
jgi:orotate phosphoribosyltransferase